MTQINSLREEVQRLKMSSKKKTKIRIHPDIDDEDTMLMTVRSFLDLQQRLEQMTCPVCTKRINGDLILERKYCQYRLFGICESCYAQLLWINSVNHTKPGIIRKFAESMTVSGINYWQYKRYFTPEHPMLLYKCVYMYSILLVY